MQLNLHGYLTIFLQEKYITYIIAHSDERGQTGQ